MKIDKNLPWTAITYPQDFSLGGLELGKKTISRLQQIILTKCEGKYNISAIALASGFGPDKDEYPKQQRSFESMMKDWLISNGEIPDKIVYCSHNAKVWNCIEMTLEIIRMIKAHNLPKNVLVVSNYFHIYPRMWITWMILCSGKSGWNLAFCPERKGTSEFFHELGGTIKYIPLALWYRHNV